MLSWSVIAVIAVCAWIASYVFGYYRRLADVHYLPGPRYLWSPFSLFGSVLPSTSWNAGILMGWTGRYDLWRKAGTEVIAAVPLLPGRPIYYTSSVEVGKLVLANKSDWDKVPESVDSLKIFGENLFSCFRDGWPRHRRIVAPGFNQKLYEQVWSESIRTYYDMINSEGWINQLSTVIPDITATTSKIALYLIASCGFGMTLSWDDTVGERIRGMTLPECFHIASGSIIPQIFLPKWFFQIPFKPLRRIYEANLVLESILIRMIEKRRVEGPSAIQEKNEKDVFSLLLNANEAEADSKAALTDRELISNVFLLMLAGHETTSRGLGATLGLIACNPEAQEKAHQQIMSVVTDGRDPTIQDSEALSYVTACFLEGMRVFPSVTAIPRRAMEDTVIPVRAKDGGSFNLAVKKDQYIIMDFIAMCYNERYYPSPGDYRPERWLDPKIEQGLNFSSGPRVCVGRKFALTEGTCMLAMILRDWKIEPILHGEESLWEWRMRCMDGAVAASIGFGPKPFPLRFTKREKKLIPV